MFKNNLEVIDGDNSWTLPMPARFVIGPDGIIRYAEESGLHAAPRSVRAVAGA